MSDESPCGSCPGLCCSFRRGKISFLGLEEGERYDSRLLDYDHIDELVREGGSLLDMEWVVVTHPTGERFLSFECNHLTDGGDCGVYDDRPEMCRRFACDVLEAFEEGEEPPSLEEHMGRPEGQLEVASVKVVTDRVNEILERKAAEP